MLVRQFSKLASCLVLFVWNHTGLLWLLWPTISCLANTWKPHEDLPLCISSSPPPPPQDSSPLCSCQPSLPLLGDPSWLWNGHQCDWSVGAIAPALCCCLRPGPQVGWHNLLLYAPTLLLLSRSGEDPSSSKHHQQQFHHRSCRKENYKSFFFLWDTIYTVMRYFCSALQMLLGGKCVSWSKYEAMKSHNLQTLLDLYHH